MMWPVSRNLELVALQIDERTAGGQPITADDARALARFLRELAARAKAKED